MEIALMMAPPMAWMGDSGRGGATGEAILVAVVGIEVVGIETGAAGSKPLEAVPSTVLIFEVAEDGAAVSNV
jgi:hypothetical protein